MQKSFEKFSTDEVEKKTIETEIVELKMILDLMHG
jgi:hypothetical protein